MHFKALKQPRGRAWIPQDRTCSLWVSLKLTSGLTIPSTYSGRELFHTVLQAGTGTNWPPASPRRTSYTIFLPSLRLQSGGLFWELFAELLFFHVCGSLYDAFILFTLEIVNFCFWQGPKLWAPLLNWSGDQLGACQKGKKPPCESSVSLSLRRPYDNADSLRVVPSALQTPVQEEALPWWHVFSPWVLTLLLSLWVTLGRVHHSVWQNSPVGLAFSFQILLYYLETDGGNFLKKEIGILFCPPRIYWGFEAATVCNTCLGHFDGPDCNCWAQPWHWQPHSIPGEAKCIHISLCLSVSFNKSMIWVEIQGGVGYSPHITGLLRRSPHAIHSAQLKCTV